MSRPVVGALVHLVCARPGWDRLYCASVAVSGHCDEPASDGGEGDCVHLRRLDRDEVTEHVPHDDGTAGARVGTWHHTSTCA